MSLSPFFQDVDRQLASNERNQAEEADEISNSGSQMVSL